MRMALLEEGAARIATVASAGVGFDFFSKLVMLPVLGAPVTSFGAAAAGAGLSLFFGDPIEDKRQLWGQLLAACIFGTVFSVLVTDWLALSWAAKHPGMFALASAALIRWFLPVTIDRIKQLIREYRISLSLSKVKKESDS